MSNIPLPYLPENREILYVSDDDIFLQEAKKVAEKFSLDPDHPIGCVVVKNGEVIGFGANGSDYHEKYGCERKRLNIPTGEGYELCEGCHPKNHAEQTAIANVQKKFGEKSKEVLVGADVYLWGHWWCCHSCWGVMISVGIGRVFLWEKASEYWAY